MLHRTDNIIWTHVEEFLNFVPHFLFRHSFCYVFLLILITYCQKLNSFSSKAAKNFWYLTVQTPFRTCESVTPIIPSFEMLVIGSQMFGYICLDSQWRLLHSLRLCLKAEEFPLTLTGKCLSFREIWKCEWKNIFDPGTHFAWSISGDQCFLEHTGKNVDLVKS